MDLSYDIKNLDKKNWTDLSSILSQITRLTDGQTDRILIARPRLHSMERGNNWVQTREGKVTLCRPMVTRIIVDDFESEKSYVVSSYTDKLYIIR